MGLYNTYIENGVYDIGLEAWPLGLSLDIDLWSSALHCLRDCTSCVKLFTMYQHCYALISFYIVHVYHLYFCFGKLKIDSLSFRSPVTNPSRSGDAKRQTKITLPNGTQSLFIGMLAHVNSLSNHDDDLRNNVICMVGVTTILSGMPGCGAQSSLQPFKDRNWTPTQIWCKGRLK